VELTKDGFSSGLSAQTDEDGKYTIEKVLVGVFDVIAHKAKYSVEKVKNVKVEVGKATTVNIAMKQMLITTSAEEYEALEPLSPPVSQTKDGVRVTITEADWEFVTDPRAQAFSGGMRFVVRHKVEDINKPERQWKLDKSLLLDQRGNVSRGPSSCKLDPNAPSLTVRARFKDASAPPEAFGEFHEDLNLKAVPLPVNTNKVEVGRHVTSKLGTKVILERVELGVNYREEKVTRLTFRVEKSETVVLTGIPLGAKEAIDNTGKRLRRSGGSWGDITGNLEFAGHPSVDATTLDIMVSLKQTVPSQIQKDYFREFVFHLDMPEPPVLSASARYLPIASEKWNNVTVTVDAIFFREGGEHYMKPGEQEVVIWFTTKTGDEDRAQKGKWIIDSISSSSFSRRDIHFPPRDIYYFRPDGRIAAENETIQPAFFRWRDKDVNELDFSLDLKRAIRGSEFVRIRDVNIPEYGEALKIGQQIKIKRDDTDVMDLTIEELRAFSSPEDLIDLGVREDKAGLALVVRYTHGELDFPHQAASDDTGTTLRFFSASRSGGRRTGEEKTWVLILDSPSEQATTVDIELAVDGIRETDRDAITFNRVTYAEPHRRLAEACYEKGALADAIAEFKEAIKLSSDVVPLYIRLGDIYREQGMVQQAIAEYKEAIKKIPKYQASRLHLELGDIYHEQSMLDKAAAEYYESQTQARAKIEQDSMNPWLYNNLAWFYVEKKIKPKEAISMARKAVGLAPGNAAILDTLGWAYLRNGQFDEALQTFSEVFSIDPRSTSSWNGVSEIAQSALEPEVFLQFCDEIAKALEEAGESTPIQVHTVLAQFYNHRGEKEKAQSKYAKTGFPQESDWLVIGPFDNTDDKGRTFLYPPETEIDFAKIYPGKTGTVQWQKADDGQLDGKLDFTKFFTPTKWVVAYALIDVISSDNREAQLRIGSDDGVKVLLNGQVVWTNQAPRLLKIDQDIVHIQLKQGTNRLLFKVGQGDGGWGLIFRITDETGNPIEDLRYQAASNDDKSGQ